jgi:polyhydroxyalkanoate synthase subunit PhaC
MLSTQQSLNSYAPPRAFDERLNAFTRAVKTRVPIAQTPKSLIWSLNKARLYRYAPVLPAEKRHKVPLLLVFAIMNRPYILDLMPGRSFVEFMVNHGYDVYLLDWGIPGMEDKDLKFDDYALEYLPRAIRKVKSVSGSETFSLLGWCLGAVVSAIYAALRPDDGLRNLLLLTAPLDFSERDSITISHWVDKKYFNLERILSTYGNMPAEMIGSGAQLLKPVENFVVNYCRLWDNLENARAVKGWQAMNTWVSDNIPMAGGACRQLIGELYRDNALIENRFNVRGEVVNLSKITANLLNIIATDDHITPPCQSESILDKVSSADKETYRIQGGHIGIMAGSSAPKKSWPYMDQWLSARSD